MKPWLKYFLGFIALYALLWLAAWLRDRAAGDRRWTQGLLRGIHAVGRFNAGVILSTFYLAILPLFAVFFIAKDVLRVRPRPGAATHWVPVKEVPVTPERFSRPF